MPTVTNPCTFDLFCLPVGRVLVAGETVPVTDEQAASVSPTVFVVAEDEAPAAAAPAAAVEPPAPVAAKAHRPAPKASADSE